MARVFLFLLSVIVCSVSALSASSPHLLPPLAKSYRRSVLAAAESTQSPPLNVPQAQFFTQNLDHFDALVQNTYKQRYWVNDTFWNTAENPETRPVFVMIEGEGTASYKSAISGHHVQMAEKLGALVVVVEHRYYGDSVPTRDLSTENLRWLSSEQALADLAVFLEHIVDSYKLTDRNRIITFGGSYSGALSAWFRMKYPHIVYASVASSAPVHAELDFFAYNQVVAKSLRTKIVGGSEECALQVYQAFQQIDDLFATGKESDVEKLFKSCTKLSSTNDKSNFISDVAGNFQGAVQYNGQLQPSIDTLCTIMTNESIGSSVERLAQTQFASVAEENCYDYSWKGALAQLQNVTIDTNEWVGARQWTFQTCTQFGYYQTCEPWKGTCLFSSLMSLDFNVELCSDLFGLPAKKVSNRIRFSNDYYGGAHPHVSRVIFVNGVVDPWHALSVLKSDPSNDVTAIVIPGASHCQNMKDASPSDTLQMQEAKDSIETIVERWVLSN